MASLSQPESAARSLLVGDRIVTELCRQILGPYPEVPQPRQPIHAAQPSEDPVEALATVCPDDTVGLLKIGGPKLVIVHPERMILGKAWPYRIRR
jgi:hypothetical protein